MKRLVLSLGLVMLAVFASAPAPVTAQATSGEITVYNESGFEVYIYINGSERGRLDPGYSKCFRVPLGEHRVEARTDSKFDKDGHKDFVLTGYYSYDSWYIHNSDLN